MKIRKLFELQSNRTSYTRAAIKIVVCLMILLGCFYRRRFLYFSGSLAKIVDAVLCTALIFACFHVLGCSVGEIFETFENRKKQKLSDAVYGELHTYSIDEVVTLAKSCDIVEIELLTNGKTLTVGASSDSEPGRSELFDKLYYVDKKEYAAIADFRAALLPLTVDGKLYVYCIDGFRLNRDGGSKTRKIVKKHRADAEDYRVPALTFENRHYRKSFF